MTSGEYRAAAMRLEEVRRGLLAVSREQSLGSRERLAAVLSGAAAGFLTDRLEQCGRELAAAARILGEAAAAALRTAQTLEAAEALAAAPLPAAEDDREEEPVAEPPDEDLPVPDLLTRIRTKKIWPTYIR